MALFSSPDFVPSKREFSFSFFLSFHAHVEEAELADDTAPNKRHDPREPIDRIVSTAVGSSLVRGLQYFIYYTSRR